MTSIDKYRLAQKRAEFVAHIVEIVQRNGFCEMPRYNDALDDPPDSALMQAMRIFQEAAAEREGPRQHLEAPHTLYGDIKAECDRRGWVIQFDPGHYCHVIVEPMLRRECKACGGHGRIVEPMVFSLDMGPDAVVQTKVCEDCKGLGYKESRREK